MSIERFLATNLLMDLPLLAIAARCMGTLDRRRLCACALIAIGYGALAAAVPSPWRAPPVQLSLLALTGWLTVGRHREALIARSMVCLVGCAAFIAGWLQLAGSMGPLSIVAGFALLIPLLLAGGARRRRWEAEISLEVGGQRRRFVALIDTGNRLREPCSGLPVMIVDAAVVAGMPMGTPTRRVAYGALGGEGILPCFRPDAVWCLRGRRRFRAPEVWVAVSPAPLPGGCRALAPCEFASLPI